jgi:hypothetical protein
VIANTVLASFFGREREKTPHNPHARQLHLPTSSSRAIISYYNIALGQLEVEDYPVC